MKKIILITIFNLFFFILAASPVRADGINLGVYPPIFQAETTPPSDISVPLNVYNFSDSPLELRIIIKPFTQRNSETGEVSYIDKSPTEEFISKNVRILSDKNQISSFTLTAKEIKKLTLKITIAKDQSRSDYYFSVIFLSTNLGTNDSNASSSLGGVATNVLISVGPKGPTNGEISEFSAPFFLRSGPVPFTLKVFNSSNHFITPKGNIMVKNMFGQTIGKVDLLPVNILSQTARYIPDFQSYLLSIKGKGSQFDQRKAFWHEKLLLGYYTAIVNVSLSEQGPKFTRSIHFFAFPIEAVLAIIMVIFLILLIRKKISQRLRL